MPYLKWIITLARGVVAVSRAFKFEAFFLQKRGGECALACLGFVACELGIRISLDEMRDRFRSMAKGASLADLCGASSALGMQCAAFSGKLPDLLADTRYVLHWNDNHFVVLLSFLCGRYYVFDPRIGVVCYSTEDFLASYGGRFVAVHRSSAAEGFGSGLRKLGLCDRFSFAKSDLSLFVVGLTVPLLAVSFFRVRPAGASSLAYAVEHSLALLGFVFGALLFLRLFVEYRVLDVGRCGSDNDGVERGLGYSASHCRKEIVWVVLCGAWLGFFSSAVVVAFVVSVQVLFAFCLLFVVHALAVWCCVIQKRCCVNLISRLNSQYEWLHGQVCSLDVRAVSGLSRSNIERRVDELNCEYLAARRKLLRLSVVRWACYLLFFFGFALFFYFISCRGLAVDGLDVLWIFLLFFLTQDLFVDSCLDVIRGGGRQIVNGGTCAPVSRDLDLITLGSAPRAVVAVGDAVSMNMLINFFSTCKFIVSEDEGVEAVSAVGAEGDCGSDVRVSREIESVFVKDEFRFVRQSVLKLVSGFEKLPDADRVKDVLRGLGVWSEIDALPLGFHTEVTREWCRKNQKLACAIFLAGAVYERIPVVVLTGKAVFQVAQLNLSSLEIAKTKVVVVSGVKDLPKFDSFQVVWYKSALVRKSA
ncbi:cysteine peptidase family C39 domain-containing protein [Uliginosibacterium sp. TH139]|uniref:cysteine peptidase family C39 domain-containing protein n=1 Tax=Uliginosibacterium sp. TH139 TaxID=2067453 RepID=UPI000C7A4F07|nr:cysteine peptidase family C39 domain-containing protein [Uliginosibacterium sp. TH139]PLK48582.1 hypothetical protein C0V76_11000 [Uliginosibacterium sp. TH139]